MTPATLPFQDEVELFELKDKIAPPPVAPILFYGSSSIRLWDTAEVDFSDWTIVRRGIGGATLLDCNLWCERLVIRYAPSEIIFYAGENDLGDGASPETILHRLQVFIHQVQHAMGPIPIMVISIKPSPERWHLLDRILTTNRLFNDLTRHYKHVKFLDVAPHMVTSEGKPRTELYIEDGLHLSAKGYALWTELVRENAKM